MRALTMNELSSVAGGAESVILPTVTITYNKAANTTYYYMEGAATGHLLSNSSVSDGGGGSNKDLIEAELQLATAVLGIGAAVTAIPFPAISAVFALGAVATGAGAFAVSKSPQP